MVQVKKQKLAKGDWSGWTDFGNKSGPGNQFWQEILQKLVWPILGGPSFDVTGQRAIGI